MPQHSTITIDTIYPASEKHISKHTPQSYVMVSKLDAKLQCVRLYPASSACQVTETCQRYEKFVVPYIRSLPESRIQWVRNILDKKV